MTKLEFIKNNRGINDNSDLPQEFLEGIYDEIESNEIKMKDDPIAAAATSNPTSNLTERQRIEAYSALSKEMASKTELTVNSRIIYFIIHYF